MCAYITGGVVLKLADILMSKSTLGVTECQSKTNKLAFLLEPVYVLTSTST